MCCSVNGYVCLCVACVTLFVNCLVKEFAICFGVVVILVSNVMEVLCWIDRAWSFKESVCCACDPSVYLDVSSIGFVYVCVYCK